MFIDLITIYAKAGNGGNGAISFRREKYVPNGGPDGGDGGRGGNIVFYADEGSNTLLSFRYKRKFIAENGQNGMGGKMHGKNGEDVRIPVPPGTLIKDKETGRLLCDIGAGEEKIICRGGKGGWGNRHFATPTRQIPRFAKNGTKGEERELTLELKMLADVGLIGLPSVGKSSVLSRISSAKPKIAAYHFTTLSPNLGVVSVGEGRGFVCADVPGLISGASEGLGLGLAFLRHVERCRLLLHVVDIACTEGRDPKEDFDTINAELEKFSPELMERKQIVVGNKIDALTPDIDTSVFKDYVLGLGYEYIEVSAVTGEGLDKLVRLCADELEKLPPMIKYEPDYVEEEEVLKTAAETTVRRDNKVFYVEGDWLYNFMGRINFDDRESIAYFQRMLIKSGIIKMLEDNGINDGDTVNIYDFEFDFVK